MEESEEILFNDVLSCLKEIRDNIKFFTNKSAKELRFLNAEECAKILHKNKEDMRKIMRSGIFPTVPDKIGDLKVEEQAFIRWCRCEKVDYDEELLERFLNEKEERV